MASTRASATRVLSQVTRARCQTRQLHLTGSSNHPVRTAAVDRPVLQKLPQASACKAQIDEATRAFSTSDSAYDSPNALRPSMPADRLAIHPTPTPTPFSPTNQNRHFNTSRELKQVGDSSTIDFAYLPAFPMPSLDAVDEDIRVPLVPWDFTPRREEVFPPLVSELIAEQMPTISTVAADGTHISAPSAMADVHDGGGHLLDFHEMAETLTNAAKKVTLGMERDGGAEVKRAKGLVKQVWTGLLDDLFGQKMQKT